ncbi:hypothetical protein L9X50_14305, partial [Vibrio aestuarianus]|nr:hypothetical protein [Vibrio aestuarianus]
MGRSTFLLGSNLAAGQSIAVDINGNVRILNLGEKALPSEIIMSPSNLGENDGALNTNVQISQIAPDGSGTDITDDVNAIFAALEQGQDPTQLGEELATAAGESNGSSPTDSVSIARDGAEIIAATNFDTSALTSLGLSQTQSLGLLEQYLNISEAIITDGGNGPGPNPDNDKPALEISGGGAVNEGTNAEFVVTLTKATEADVVLNLGVSTDGAYSAEAGDVGGLSVSYEQGGQTLALAVDPNGNVTVPAGVTAIRVVVATTP